MNHTQKVKQFTEESMGTSVPRYPQPMTREQVVFLVRMQCEEMMELLCTIREEGEDEKELLRQIVEKSNKPMYNKKSDTIDIMCEQVDYVVDSYYYGLNACCKQGFNVDEIFDIVHEANMSKKFEDGKFRRNELGKVIKPEGWKEPNVRGCVEKWIKNGSW